LADRNTSPRNLTGAELDEFGKRWAQGERCHAGRDGDCIDKRCPQVRDGEPLNSGRHCPLDLMEGDDE